MSLLFATPSSTPGASRASGYRLTSHRLEAFGLSHPGLARPTNQDAYLIEQPIGLFGVADGMGGAAAGEVAART